MLHRLILTATICLVSLLGSLRAADPASVERVQLLSGVKRFGYQLQKLDVKKASASAADLLVIEPHGDGKPRTPAEVATGCQRARSPTAVGVW